MYKLSNIMLTVNHVLEFNTTMITIKAKSIRVRATNKKTKFKHIQSSHSLKLHKLK